MSLALREALSRTLLLASDSDVIGDNRVSDEQFIEAFRTTRVLLVANEANLSAPAGQHALVSLFNLVARLGVSIGLAFPDVPILGNQPPIRKHHLRTGLLDLGADLLPDCPVSEGLIDEPADMVFLLGDTEWNGQVTYATRLTGTDWSGTIAPAAERVERWTQSFPIGALTAAAIAAPEVFKGVLRKVAATLPNPTNPDFLAPINRAAVWVAPISTPVSGYELGRVDAISGGAIINSVIYTLLHLPDLGMQMRVIEPERHDLSNLNRYMLLRRSQSTELKIDALAHWQRPGVSITGIQSAYTPENRGQFLPLASRILVGTDDIPARWAVQREWPEWLGVGATSHFLTVTSSHTIKQPCVGCLHPYDDADAALIPTTSFVSFWAGLLLAVRLLRHSCGQKLKGKEQRINCTPLRLDQGAAYREWPVAPSRSCPVSCSAARK